MVGITSCETRARDYVLPESTIYTDEFEGYTRLGDRYKHKRIKHRARVYVDGDVHTQAIERSGRSSKTASGEPHHPVSQNHLKGYLSEYAWRYNPSQGSPHDVPGLAPTRDH